MNTIIALFVFQTIASLVKSLIRQNMPDCVDSGYTSIEFNRFGLRLQHVSQPINWLKVGQRVVASAQKFAQTVVTTAAIVTRLNQLPAHVTSSRGGYAYVAAR